MVWSHFFDDLDGSTDANGFVSVMGYNNWPAIPEHRLWEMPWPRDERARAFLCSIWSSQVHLRWLSDNTEIETESEMELALDLKRREGQRQGEGRGR